MTESKIELTTRLRREGRWDEASLFKDTVIKECRARGLKKAEATEHGWEEMAKAFPPLPPVEPPLESLPAVQPSGGMDGGHDAGTAEEPGGGDIDAFLERVGDREPPDLARDILWVYGRLSDRRAKPEDAPTVGAWSLLLWAREYRNRFFEQLLPKAMAAHPGDAEEDVRKERMKIEEIKALLSQMREQEEQKLLADVPGVIREKVRGLLSGWSGRFGLSIPDDAYLAMQAHVCELAKECAGAFAPSVRGN